MLMLSAFVCCLLELSFAEPLAGLGFSSCLLPSLPVLAVCRSLLVLLNRTDLNKGELWSTFANP
jgi:hypothetical protein